MLECLILISILDGWTEIDKQTEGERGMDRFLDEWIEMDGGLGRWIDKRWIEREREN